jgi:hypothetical protein
MKDDTIKKILSNDLKKISSKNFNEEIIKQLNFENKKQRSNLFDQNSIIKIFLIVAFLVLLISLKTIEKLTETEIVIGIFICAFPMYFMVFNKIYLLKLKNS